MKTKKGRVLKNLLIESIQVVLLDESGFSEKSDPKFTIEFKGGFKAPPIKEQFLLPNLKNFAMSVSDDYSLCEYSLGDRAIFTVKYKKSPKGELEEFFFYSKEGDVFAKE